MKRAVIGIVLVVASAATHALSGVVSRVGDGDTLWVQSMGRHHKPVKLRLQGIDAPEICQAGGAQAAAALAARVLHRSVQVQIRATDDYRRKVGNVRLEGEDIGAWMVSQGHAWSYRHGHHPGPYAEQERQARAAGRGIFAHGNAVEPRLFRRTHGPCR